MLKNSSIHPSQLSSDSPSSRRRFVSNSRLSRIKSTRVLFFHVKTADNPVRYAARTENRSSPVIVIILQRREVDFGRALARFARRNELYTARFTTAIASARAKHASREEVPCFLWPTLMSPSEDPWFSFPDLLTPTPIFRPYVRTPWRGGSRSGEISIPGRRSLESNIPPLPTPRDIDTSWIDPLTDFSCLLNSTEASRKYT